MVKIAGKSTEENGATSTEVPLDKTLVWLVKSNLEEIKAGKERLLATNATQGVLITVVAVFPLS